MIYNHETDFMDTDVLSTESGELSNEESFLCRLDSGK
jgi:hypothetical protein